MRIITSSFLRKIPIKYVNYTKQFCSNSFASKNLASPTLASNAEADNLVEVSPEWAPHEAPEFRAQLLRGVSVIPDFVTEAEETSLMEELEPYLKKMRYEFDHWDNAIQGYRETERSQWSAANLPLVERLRARARAAGGGALLPRLHVLDLAPDGHIRPHVDSVRFCGDVIVGLCLLSSAVMVVCACEAPARWVRALLPRRAAYALSGVARLGATHAVPGGADSAWGGRAVPRQRRVSIMCRSAPRPPSAPQDA